VGVASLQKAYQIVEQSTDKNRPRVSAGKRNGFAVPEDLTGDCGLSLCSSKRAPARADYQNDFKHSTRKMFPPGAMIFFDGTLLRTLIYGRSPMAMVIESAHVDYDAHRAARKSFVAGRKKRSKAPGPKGAQATRNDRRSDTKECAIR